MTDKASRNIKLTIEYDGTNYFGWQSQRAKSEGRRAKSKKRRADVPTIQSEIIKAIKKVTGETVTLYGAGRTDAGVHALGQVANFHTRSTIPIGRFAHAINAHLSEDITIKEANEASPDFNSQFDAVSKMYRYTVLNRDTPSAVMRNYYYLVRSPLDEVKMRIASQNLIGEKDFRAFATENKDKENTVRRINYFDIKREDGFVYFEVNGDGFLYNMVRAIVGTLLLVGLGKLSPEGVKQILDSRDRKMAGANVPAKGLCLMEVKYK